MRVTQTRNPTSYTVLTNPFHPLGSHVSCITLGYVEVLLFIISPRCVCKNSFQYRRQKIVKEKILCERKFLHFSSLSLRQCILSKLPKRRSSKRNITRRMDVIHNRDRPSGLSNHRFNKNRDFMLFRGIVYLLCTK